MSVEPALDLADLRRWIGRTDTATDTVSRRLVNQFSAVVGCDPADTGHAPAGIHWCLAPAAVRSDLLDVDGHPTRGTFLPPVPLPRRMWAGSDVSFVDSLRIDDRVTRTSRIADVVGKHGTSGALCFVAIEHEFATPRGVAIRERQDLVFRAPAPPVAAPSIDRTLTPLMRDPVGPVPLFRYAALTFNAHRIHYDRDYARDVEGYAGLVVQGPLQATWLLQAATAQRGRMPQRFTFRGIRPLTDIEPYRLRVETTGVGMGLSIDAVAGATMEADATW